MHACTQVRMRALTYIHTYVPVYEYIHGYTAPFKCLIMLLKDAPLALNGFCGFVSVSFVLVYCSLKTVLYIGPLVLALFRDRLVNDQQSLSVKFYGSLTVICGGLKSQRP